MHSLRSKSLVNLLLLSALATLPAAAQDAQQAPPDWRLDIDVPGVGAAAWVESGPSVSDHDVEGAPVLELGGSFIHSSGHGALLRLNWLALPWGSPYGGGVIGAIGIETAYQYSITLAGDLRSGVSLQPYVGAFIGSVQNGLGIGPLAGASIDFRIWEFNLGIDLSYRALFSPGNNRALDMQHGMAATLRIGFSFWGV
jgi:hypothetical protein